MTIASGLQLFLAFAVGWVAHMWFFAAPARARTREKQENRERSRATIVRHDG